MEKVRLIAPCHFGLEAVLKREVLNLGYEIDCVEDGRVTFLTDLAGIARANIFLRTADRILLQVGKFHAETFDDLFEGIKAIPWENYLTEDARFCVTKASTTKSRLFSAPDIQSIAKKAMVERMKKKYHIQWFQETGASYPVRIFLLKDEVISPTTRRAYNQTVNVVNKIIKLYTKYYEIENITIDDNNGVILSSMYSFLSKSPLKDKPIKLNTPIIKTIKNI